MHPSGSHHLGLVAGDDGDYEFGRMAIWVGGAKIRGLVLLPPMGVGTLATPDRHAGVTMGLPPGAVLPTEPTVEGIRDGRAAPPPPPFGPPSTTNRLTHM